MLKSKEGGKEKDNVKTGGMVKRNSEGVAYPVGSSVFDPNADWRQNWDLICMVLLLFCAFVTPFEIAFLAPQGLPKPDGLWWLNHGIDLVFIVDMLLNFNTGFFSYRHGTWVVQRRKVILAYMKGACF